MSERSPRKRIKEKSRIAIEHLTKAANYLAECSYFANEKNEGVVELFVRMYQMVLNIRDIVSDSVKHF